MDALSSVALIGPVMAGNDAVVVPDGLGPLAWLRAAGLLVGGLLLAVLVHRLVVRAVGGGSPGRKGAARLLGRLAATAVACAGLVYALASLGVRIGPLLGALGIAGIAVAFALQDILENFVAGIIIQARNPFRFGDQVTSGEWQGTVEDINFRSVVLRTLDGTRVVLPSAAVLKVPIQNLTAFGARRTEVSVGVAYGTDLGQARDLMVHAVGGADGVLSDPAAEALVEELGADGVTFAVRFWHRPQVADMWAARDAALRAVHDALRAAGIEIPFPQRTISFASERSSGAARR